MTWTQRGDYGPLFRAEQLRDEGTARVEASQARDDDGAWRSTAFAVLQSLAVGGEEFNADDLRAIAGSPTRPNAMGALFLRAVRSGLIERVGERKRSAANAHAQRIAVYRGRRG